jgi:hypothetical protein
VMEAGVIWNYTTWLNIAFLILATTLVIRFVRTGGIAMLSMMGGSPDAVAEHSHLPRHGAESNPDSKHGAGHEHGHRQP